MRAPPDTLINPPDAEHAVTKPSPPPEVFPPSLPPPRCLTIDVEEYFHIEAAHARVPRPQWDTLPSRVQRNVDLLLELLSRHRVPATFFFLGDVARRNPKLAAQVAKAGHEVASHGFSHDRLHRLDPTAFRRDILASKRMLEDQTGRSIAGYRAPTFSLMPATAWAIDILLDVGFKYDSSIFPVRHPSYGVPSAPDRPYLVRAHPNGPTLLEIPPLTLALGYAGLKRNLPVAGGGYFRLLPLALMEMGLRQAAAQDRPAVLYFHPWEFDPDMPRLPLSPLGRFRTYTGLARSTSRLERILAQPARWSTLSKAVPDLLPTAFTAPVFSLTRQSGAT